MKKRLNGISVKCCFNNSSTTRGGGLCHISFHIECARRAGYHMQISPESKGTSNEQLQIFCIRHRPFTMRTDIKKKEKEVIDKIFGFS
jgi:hypothetical protein